MGVTGDSDSLKMQVMEQLPIVKQINEEFRDPVSMVLWLVSFNNCYLLKDKSTFVCVCIPEFLSLYETERLVQKLTEMSIDVQNIVVNQLLQPDRNDKGNIHVNRLVLAL